MPTDIPEKFEKLRNKFIQRLPERLTSIREQYEQLKRHDDYHPALETLYRLLHSLKASAGTMNLPSISDAARKLEAQLAPLLQSQSPVLNQDVMQKLEHDLGELAEKIQSVMQGELLTQESGGTRSKRPVILVESDPEQVKPLSQWLNNAGFRVNLVKDSDHLLRSCKKGAEPVAIILDLDNAGEAVLEQLPGLKSEVLDQIPLIAMSQRDDLAIRLTAYRAGAVSFLQKPVDSRTLLRSVEQLTYTSRTEPYRVLLVDDDPDQLKLYSEVLTNNGMHVLTVLSPLQVTEKINYFEPDVLVLDLYMPECNGYELAAILREYEQYRFLPIVFLSAEENSHKQRLAFDFGGDDFLDKSTSHGQLVATIAAHARRSRGYAELMRNMQQAMYEREQEHMALDKHAIVSIANRRGEINYVNDTFCQISGYSRNELLGANHRLLKSDRHPPEYYKELWQTIASGQVWQGELCNRRKDGGFYWVASTIVPFLDEKGKPYRYVSIRTDITSVKENQEALRRSQIFANIGTWSWNIQNGELYWSERIATLFGYPSGELETTYENFLNAVHPDDRQKVIDAVTACIEQGEDYNIEHRCIWPDGSVHWLQERGDVVRSNQGVPLTMLGVVQDITERKEADTKLAESRANLEEAQQLAQMGHWYANMASGQVYWSDVIYEIFGQDPATFQPSVNAFYEAVHPDDVEMVKQSENIARESGIGDVINRIIRPDGEVRYVHLLANFEHTEDDMLYMNGTLQDITDIKQAEAGLDMFARVFDATDQGIGVTDNQGVLMHVNKACAYMLGYSPEEMLGRHFSEFICEDERNRVNDIIEAIYSGHNWVDRLPILRSDNSSFMSLSNIGSISDSHGQLQHIFNIFTDISAELARQEELSHARDEAEKANRAKSEFLSSMSHELRTPLNAILGFGQLLEVDDDLDDSQQDSVKEIVQAGRHLLALINEILDLARIESGHVDLSIENVKIPELINECLSLSRSLAIKREIHMEVKSLKNHVVRADRMRLKQALLNLIGNAIKYNHEKGSVTIETVLAGKNHVQICVSDTGVGLNEEQKQKLFQPFVRLAPDPANIEGSGIGLVISRQLVELMNGTIGVESSPGEGSTFWIKLPIASVDENGLDKPSSADSSLAALDQFGQGIRLLHIEDNAANRKLIHNILAPMQNLELLMAETGCEGLAKAHAHCPDLILMDISLPDMVGYELLQQVRNAEWGKSIPMIALSANAMEVDIQRGLEAGFDAYLTKPVQIEELLSTLERFLRISRASD